MGLATWSCILWHWVHFKLCCILIWVCCILHSLGQCSSYLDNVFKSGCRQEISTDNINKWSSCETERVHSKKEHTLLSTVVKNAFLYLHFWGFLTTWGEVQSCHNIALWSHSVCSRDVSQYSCQSILWLSFILLSSIMHFAFHKEPVHSVTIGIMHVSLPQNEPGLIWRLSCCSQFANPIRIISRLFKCKMQHIQILIEK